MTSVPGSGQDNAERLFHRAFALHHRENDIAAAQALYEQVIARCPEHAQAFHSLGAIAYAQGRRQDAIELFARAISLQGTQPVFHHSLAQALRADGNTVAALEALERSISLNPEFLGAWAAVAEIHYALNDMDEAAQAIGRVGELLTATAVSHLKQGNALVLEKKYSEAVIAYRAGIDCNPYGWGLYYNLGNVLIAQQEFADAVCCLSQAAKLAPDIAAIQVNLSNALWFSGDPKAALAVREAALNLDPTIAPGRFASNVPR
jgi:tetratricopeptide (TPR) repeat protein